MFDTRQFELDESSKTETQSAAKVSTAALQPADEAMSPCSLNARNAACGSVFMPIVSLSEKGDAHDRHCERPLRSVYRQQFRRCLPFRTDKTAAPSSFANVESGPAIARNSPDIPSL